MADVLVLEDEESLLQTLRYNQSRAGHEVRLCTDGRVACSNAFTSLTRRGQVQARAWDSQFASMWCKRTVDGFPPKAKAPAAARHSALPCPQSYRNCRQASQKVLPIA